MELYAVINGDVIRSTKMSVKDREVFMKYLHQGFELLKRNKSFGVIKSFEMYRGDSFQGALSKPEKSLRVALLLRCISRMGQRTKVRVNVMAKKVDLGTAFDVIDLRLAVGIGTVTTLSNKLMESDGEAFHRSGRLFDSMKRSGSNLVLETPSEALNKEFEASWSLIDALVNKWTRLQAEAIYYCLQGYTQIEIANNYIKTSPPALNQRLRGAGWSALEKMIDYFEETLLNRIA